MTRHNADITTVTCTACGQEFDEKAFDEHLRIAHPERWAFVMGEVAKRLDAHYPEGWVMPKELVDQGYWPSNLRRKSND